MMQTGCDTDSHLIHSVSVNLSINKIFSNTVISHVEMTEIGKPSTQYFSLLVNPVCDD